MSKFLQYHLFLVFFFNSFILNKIEAQNYSGGSGTVISPYLISNKADLLYLSNNSGEWSKHFKQTANIHFTSVDFTVAGAYYNSGLGFSPIGNLSTAFAGSYDGNNFFIDSLFINRPIDNYIGFIGYSTGSIINIGLKNVNFTGGDYVGGIIGENVGLISTCYASGNIIAIGPVGGISGLNGHIISNCYSLVNTFGNNENGGLIGSNYAGNVRNCYSKGFVSGGLFQGGLVGYKAVTSNIDSCFWDVQSSGQLSSDGGIGKSSLLMKTLGTFSNAGWDLVGETTNGTKNIWEMGNCNINDGYPVFNWQSNFSGGEGTTSNPYLISNKEGLKFLSETPCLWTKHFKQINNINFNNNDFTSGGNFYNAGTGFRSLGDSSFPFTGSYNGNGYSIDSLYINNVLKNYVGFIGVLGSIGSIKKLALSNVKFKGKDFVGGLVGMSFGTINECYTDGEVAANGNVGGISGSMSNGNINNCYSSINTLSNNDANGGFVGLMNGGTIINSYAKGKVTGGLYQGGFTGYKQSGNTNNCLWDLQTSSQSAAVGLGSNLGITGMTIIQMKTQSTFTNLGWDFVNETINGTDNIWKMGNCAVNDEYPIFNWLYPFSAGDGTISNPYLISNKEGLKSLSMNPCLWDKFFKQTADINFNTSDFKNGGDFYNGGSGFSPIGDNSTLFTGSYDGNTYLIDSLYINRTNQSQVGFIGSMGISGSIRKLGITNLNYKGYDQVGGLVGKNDGILSQCFTNGNLIVDGNAGGIAGYNSNNISDCYSITDIVASNSSNGGLIGYMFGGNVSNSFAAGQIQGSLMTGGLIGNKSASATINNCFWDTQTSGQLIGVGSGSSIGSQGYTTNNLNSSSLFITAGWDFVGETNNGNNGIWTITVCNTFGNYPVLAWQIISGGGEGSITHPYLVSNKKDLKVISENPCLWNKNFKQTTNIIFNSEDFKAGGDFYNSGLGFSPIGNSSLPFAGIYDGDKHYIDSLFINRINQLNGIGFIGRLGFSGTIKNIGLTHLEYYGDGQVGGIVGINIGTISQCYSSGSILGNSNGSPSVGGIAGYSENTIVNCYSSVKVNSQFGSNGGLIGYVFGGFASISNCYSKGVVVGGFFNSLSRGLIGYFFPGAGVVNNCFWDIETSGKNTSAGGIGKTSAQMKSQTTFTNATWDFVGETINGISDIWKMGNCATNNGYPVFSWQNLDTNLLLIDSVSSVVNNATCFLSSNGAIDLTINGTYPGITYNWSNLAATQDISNLTAGNYIVTVSSANGCTVKDTITVNQPSAIITSINSQTNVTCNGGNNGSVSIFVNGGVPSYTYLWSPSGGNAAAANTLSAGNYLCTVTDSNNCSVTKNVSITEPSVLNTNTSLSNVTITSSATGDSYQWINCDSNVLIIGANNQSFIANANGSYAVIVSNGSCVDTSDCVAITSLDLNGNMSLNNFIRLYSNSIGGHFTIEAPVGTRFEVFNATGQIVLKTRAQKLNTDIDLNYHANGIYMVKCYSDKVVYIQKMIKQ